MANKRKFVPETMKVLLALASVAGTVGIWNSFAQKETANSAGLEFGTGSSALPPLPTLVNLVAIDGSVVQSTAVPAEATVLRSVDMPVVAAPTQDAQGNVVVLNAPVTRSKPS